MGGEGAGNVSKQHFARCFVCVVTGPPRWHITQGIPQYFSKKFKLLMIFAFV